MCFYFFFFNDTATTEIYTLSLHDALPISKGSTTVTEQPMPTAVAATSQPMKPAPMTTTRAYGRSRSESTRLNSSHANISYAVFCLKKKKKYIYMDHNSNIYYTSLT